MKGDMKYLVFLLYFENYHFTSLNLVGRQNLRFMTLKLIPSKHFVDLQSHLQFTLQEMNCGLDSIPKIMRAGVEDSGYLLKQ